MILGWFGGEYPVAVGALDWIGLALVCLLLPALLSEAFCLLLRRVGWIRENDLALDHEAAPAAEKEETAKADA